MIAIVDYGMGNLRSVQKAFEKVGHQAVVTREVGQLKDAAKIVLPGVGAIRDAMHELERFDLVEPIKRSIDAGKPFLGICLGLQLLFDVSYEDGVHAGLSVLPGKVVRFDVPPEYKVPHMGWNTLSIKRRPPILAGVDESTHFYFVHSYYVAPSDPDVIATETDYAGPFVSMVWRDNLFATQFHPEKSQACGLEILKNFAQLDF